MNFTFKKGIPSVFRIRGAGKILTTVHLAAQSIVTRKIAVLLSPDSKIADTFGKISTNIAF
jgi:hypothetical protein